MKLKLKFTWAVNILLIFLLIISFIGSMSAIYEQLQASSAIVIFILFICFITFGILFNFFQESILNIIKFIKRKKLIFFILISIITILWQILLILGLSGNTAWDPSIITTLASHRSINGWYPDYFSYYPNNNLLLLLERSVNNILHFVGIDSYPVFIIFLTIISYFLVDCSIFILFFALKKYFNIHVAVITGILTWALLGITPMAIIPYSDILGFFISSLFLLIYSYKEIKGRVYLFGLLSGIAFLIKPSLIIFIIALVIKEGLSIRKISKPIKVIFKFIVAFLIIYIPFNIYQSHNFIVKIDSSKTMPANHFVAMGMTGTGGFNANDVSVNKKIKNPQKRKEYNNNLIKQRLGKFGVAGYTKFLILKQVNDTSDAGFGWGMDAGQGYLMPFGEKNKIQGFTRKIFLNKNNTSVDINWNGGKIISQIIWSIVLAAVIYAVTKFKNGYLILKLTILGSFIFLLLFEGGRSRYLIQFLPYIFTLAGIGISKWKRYDDKKAKE